MGRLDVGLPGPLRMMVRGRVVAQRSLRRSSPFRALHWEDPGDPVEGHRLASEQRALDVEVVHGDRGLADDRDEVGPTRGCPPPLGSRTAIR
jgi:hypothetical protein